MCGFVCPALLFGVVLPLQAQELPAPADPSFNAVYRRVKFERLYPADAVNLIAEHLRNAPDGVKGLSELAGHERTDVRMLVVLLLGESGKKEAAATLWSMLVDDSEAIRLTASAALMRLKDLTPIAVNTSGLRDPRWQVRRWVAATIGRFGDKSAEAALIDALQDEHPLVRTDVVVALETCGTDNALPSLIERLYDPSVNVRDRTAQGLGNFINPIVVDPLLEALKDPDWHVRASAAWSLKGWVVEQPAVIAPLIRTLQTDEFALVRDRSADALAFAKDELAVNALVKAVISGDRNARFHSARAIVRAEAVSAIPLLLEHREHPDPEIRQQICQIIGAIGGDKEVPVLLAAMNDTDPNVRLTAVEALRKLQTRTTTTIDLSKKLEDENPHVRAAAARTVGDLGRKDAVPQLITLLRDDNGYVRTAAAEALGKLGDESAVGPLIAVLSGDKAVAAAADEGLVLGDSESLLPEMALKKRVEEQIEAVRALAGLRSDQAVETIVEHGLQAGDPELRAESAVALGKIRAPRAAVPLEQSVQPYYAAAVGLKEIEEGNIIASGVVPDSMRQMKEKEARVRASVAWALGEIANPSTLATLSKATNDENSLVRDAAIEALQKISEKQERVLAGQDSSENGQ